MPVQRFRGVEDMPPVKMPAEGPQRMRDLRALWSGWARLLPALDVRGVHKFRSVEEVDAAHEAAARRRVDTLREQRRAAAERQQAIRLEDTHRT